MGARAGVANHSSRHRLSGAYNAEPVIIATLTPFARHSALYTLSLLPITGQGTYQGHCIDLLKFKDYGYKKKL